jgi:hypothetical protein
MPVRSKSPYPSLTAYVETVIGTFSETDTSALSAAEQHARSWKHGLLISDQDAAALSSVTQLAERIYGYRNEIAAELKSLSADDATRVQTLLTIQTRTAFYLGAALSWRAAHRSGGMR